MRACVRACGLLTPEFFWLGVAPMGVLFLASCLRPYHMKVQEDARLGSVDTKL